MKKRVAKVVMHTAGALILVTSAYIFYFESIGLPQSPRHDTGRIHAIEQHEALRGYITHEEKLARQVSFLLLTFLVVIYATTDHYFDPFGRRLRAGPRTGNRHKEISGRRAR